MGIQDRDWYRDTLRKRQGMSPDPVQQATYNPKQFRGGRQPRVEVIDHVAIRARHRGGSVWSNLILPVLTILAVGAFVFCVVKYLLHR